VQADAAFVDECEECRDRAGATKNTVLASACNGQRAMPATALTGQLPKHIGSTGGLLNSAETEEKYAITWTSSKSQAFELPTGGAALMNEGENIMYFARKEQCLALGTQLRTKFKPRIEDYKIYRIYPGGDTEYLHPKDGVFPEKVNEGRAMVGHNPRSIGANPNPAGLKFSGKATYDA
jgi:photosystem I subunit 2